MPNNFDKVVVVALHAFFASPPPLLCRLPGGAFSLMRKTRQKKLGGRERALSFQSKATASRHISALEWRRQSVKFRPAVAGLNFSNCSLSLRCSAAPIPESAALKRNHCADPLVCRPASRGRRDWQPRGLLGFRFASQRASLSSVKQKFCAKTLGVLVPAGACRFICASAPLPRPHFNLNHCFVAFKIRTGAEGYNKHFQRTFSIMACLSLFRIFRVNFTDYAIFNFFASFRFSD